MPKSKKKHNLILKVQLANTVVKLFLFFINYSRDNKQFVFSTYYSLHFLLLNTLGPLLVAQ